MWFHIIVHSESPQLETACEQAVRVERFPKNHTYTSKQTCQGNLARTAWSCVVGLFATETLYSFLKYNHDRLYTVT